MECLKFLGVFLAVFQVSKSFPRRNVDESETTHGNLFQVFDKLLEPYYGAFPSGECTMVMPLTLDEFTMKLNAWYTDKNMDPTNFRDHAFANITGEILRATFKCATAKVNQIIFHILRNFDRRMTNEDQTLMTTVRQVLANHVDANVLDEIVTTIVKTAHSRVFGEFMNYIRNFQFEGVREFFGDLREFLQLAGEKHWPVQEFDSRLATMMQDSGFDFACPSPDQLWAFHGEIARSFRERFSTKRPFGDAKEWLTEFLRTRMTSDLTTVVSEILRSCDAYINKATSEFERMEIRMSSGSNDEILKFMTGFLTSSEVQYLRSVFDEFEKLSNMERMWID